MELPPGPRNQCPLTGRGQALPGGKESLGSRKDAEGVGTPTWEQPRLQQTLTRKPAPSSSPGRGLRGKAASVPSCRQGDTACRPRPPASRHCLSWGEDDTG